MKSYYNKKSHCTILSLFLHSHFCGGGGGGGGGCSMQPGNKIKHNVLGHHLNPLKCMLRTRVV